jgi:solute carrier family 39 (zinc transporter), member 1/2/3
MSDFSSDGYDLCDENHLYGYIAIPIVFMLSVIGTATPSIIQKLRPQWDMRNSPPFRFLSGMAGGFVVSVALIHSFAEGHDSLNEEDVGWPDYAWSGLFAFFGLFVTWFCEVMVMLYLVVKKRNEELHKNGSDIKLTHPQSQRYSKQHDENHSQSSIELKKNHIDNSDQHHSDHSDHSDHADHAIEQVLTDSIDHGDASTLFLLLFGLTFHSIFVGFAIGLENDFNLFIAILCHQVFEGFAIGHHLAHYPNKTLQIVLVIIGVFSFSAPVGTALGIGISSSVCHDSSLFHAVEGTFNCFAAGVLVYVGCVHMINEEMQRAIGDVNGSLLLASGVFIGGALMAVIGIWA